MKKTYEERMAEGVYCDGLDSTPTTDWLREFLPGWQRPELPADVLCPENPHISLCIPSMDRLYHLRATLPDNLVAAEADPDCDIHVLEHSSNDGTAEYLADLLENSTSADLLQCFRTIGERYYSQPHAWNMLATTTEPGVIVVLGADCTIGPDYLPLLRETFLLHPGALICLKPRAGDRSAMTTSLLYYLGGYDLDMHESYGHEDCDILKRAVYRGAEEIWLPELASASHISHRVFRDNMFKPDGGHRYEKMSEERLAQGRWYRNAGRGWQQNVPERMGGVYAC